MKTNNPLERYLEELRRRTNPMRTFASMRSAEPIIYGIIAYVLNNDAEMPDPPAEVVRRAGTQFTNSLERTGLATSRIFPLRLPVPAYTYLHRPPWCKG